MRVVARFAMRFSFVSNRSDAVALVEEFGRVFLEELSYKHEAYNAARFGEMFKENMVFIFRRSTMSTPLIRFSPLKM